MFSPKSCYLASVSLLAFVFVPGVVFPPMMITFTIIRREAENCKSSTIEHKKHKKPLTLN